MIATALRRLAVASLAAAAAGCGETPEAAYRAIGAAAERGDWGAVYDRIDSRSRARLDRALMIAALDQAASRKEVDPAAFEDIRETDGRVLFVRRARADRAFGRGFLPSAVLSARVVGVAAELKVARMVDGAMATRAVAMVQEDGVWKLAPAARRPRLTPP